MREGLLFVVGGVFVWASTTTTTTTTGYIASVVVVVVVVVWAYLILFKIFILTPGRHTRGVVLQNINTHHSVHSFHSR